MSEDEALAYASNMLRTLSAQETHPMNEAALRYAARRLDQLREEVK